MKTKLFALLLLCTFSAIANPDGINPADDTGPAAIKGTIKGTVKDAVERKPMEYVSVAAYSLPDSALVTGSITALDGSFNIPGLPTGNYFIQAYFVGYEKKNVGNIEISKEKRMNDCGEITLAPAVASLNEVTVTAEKDVIQYNIDKKVVNVSKKPEAMGGTVANALENTPSIQLDSDGNVLLRGSTNFTVLIDGKPTAMSGNDVLKQIPAATVENVEIITNPSAKFDPDGASGIINIVMKKEFKTGLNGIVNASAGTNWQHSTDFTLNYRTEKANFFVGGNYAQRPNFPKTELYSQKLFQDTVRFVSQLADRERNNTNYSFKGGFDYYLTEKSTVTLSGEYGYFGFGMDMDSRITENTEPVSDTTYYFNQAEMAIGGNFFNTNLIFDHNFSKEHNLKASLLLSGWNGENQNTTNVQLSNNSWTEMLESQKSRTTQNDDRKDLRTKLDYTRPLTEKSKIEAGYQARFETNHADFSKENFDNATGLPSVDPTLSSGFDYARTIHSVYGTFGSELAGIKYQAGIRGEYTDRKLEMQTGTDHYTLDRFDIFPTLHLSKEFNPANQLQASYSRRINRPNDWLLNPYPMYSDNYIVQGGNPSLLPEFVDSYEMNYMKKFKIGFVSAETYYRQTNNAFSQILRLRNDGIVVITTENLSRNYSYGIQLSANLSPWKQFNVFTSVNLYNHHVEVESVSENSEKKSIGTDINVNANYTPRQGSRLQISGFYNAPRVTAQGKQAEMYGVNMSVSQEFLKRRLSVVLSARDVLKTMKYKMTTDTPDMKSDFTFHMDSPQFMISVSYKINNYKQRRENGDNRMNFEGGMF